MIGKVHDLHRELMAIVSGKQGHRRPPERGL